MALKKAKKNVPRSCGYIPLCRAKSYASLDEGGISLPSVTEREPTTNIDEKELVEQMKDHRASFTCVGKPLLRSPPCLNAEEDIIAAPSEFEELSSRKKKAKVVTPLLKNRRIKSSSFLICAALFISFCAGGIFYISSSKGEYKSKKINCCIYFAATVESKENLLVYRKIILTTEKSYRSNTSQLSLAGRVCYFDYFDTQLTIFVLFCKTN